MASIPSASPFRLGILAGGGALPIAVAQAAENPFIIGFRGHTDTTFIEKHDHRWSRIAAIGKTITALHRHQVTDVVFAGGIRRPSLSALTPDWRGLRLLHKTGWRLGGDDALLRLLIAELEQEGFRVRGAHEICPSLLLPEGCLTRIKPDAVAEADIALGLTVARDLGKHDIGQAVIVQQGQVIGVEGVEGTAALIARCAPWAQKGRRAILVKRCKPGQDMRADLPALGAETIKQAQEAALLGIVGLAGRTLLLEAQDLVERADRAGMFVAGYPVEL